MTPNSSWKFHLNLTKYFNVLRLDRKIDVWISRTQVQYAIWCYLTVITRTNLTTAFIFEVLIYVPDQNAKTVDSVSCSYSVLFLSSYKIYRARHFWPSSYLPPKPPVCLNSRTKYWLAYNVYTNATRQYAHLKQVRRLLRHMAKQEASEAQRWTDDCSNQ